MDARYFLRERTKSVRYFYEGAAAPFEEIQRKITNQEPAFDNPPYSEDPEPAFLEEWLDAQTALQMLGFSCVALLSETLKLYFERLRTTVIRFEFQEGHGPSKKRSFVECYRLALGEILGTDWTNTPISFDLIEQVVLVRNRTQHGGDLTSFAVNHDPRTLRSHPRPFFAEDADLQTWADNGSNLDTFFAPRVEVTRETLFAALEHSDMLADWVEDHWDKVLEWRRRSRPASP